MKREGSVSLRSVESEMENWLSSHAVKHTVGDSSNKYWVKIFSFPDQLLSHLTSVGASATDISRTRSEVTNLKENKESALGNEFQTPNTANFRGQTCLACGLKFDEQLQQQIHFKTDLHRTNLKRRLRNLPALTALSTGAITSKSYALHASDEVEDISGSDSDGESDGSGSEAEAEGDSAVLKLQETVDEESDLLLQPSAHESAKGSITKAFSSTDGATYRFHPSFTAYHFTVHASAFLSAKSEDGKVIGGLAGRNWLEGDPWSEVAEQVRRWKQNSLCAVVLLRSGRFAGAIFDGNELLLHKVIRRYTVRAKSGGGQSSHDNKGRKAKSMGAQLRRYGEQALKEDVQALLRQWSGHLQSCSAIFVAVPKTMRSVIFDEAAKGSSADHGPQHSEQQQQLLRKDDERICYVPFATGRPTLEAAKLAHGKCTSVLFSNSKETPAAVAEDGDASTPLISTLNPNDLRRKREVGIIAELNDLDPGVTTSGTVGETASDHPMALEILLACLAGDESAVIDALQRAEGASSSSEGEMDSSVVGDEAASLDADTSSATNLTFLLSLPDSLDELRTPLHIAAALGMTRAVRLLLRKGANPTARDIRDRVPYFLSKDKETRDTFRRFRAEVGEEGTWDWHAAGVGPALSQEAEQAQKQKEKEKKKRQAQKKKDLKQQQEQEAADAARKLERQREQEELEKSQRLAIAKQSAGACAVCSKALYGAQALEVFDKRCCSAACVQRLRRQLAADAASRRMLPS